MNVSIGDRKLQKYNLEATVIEIVGDSRCKIRFDNGVEKEVSFLTFKKGLSSGLIIDKTPKVGDIHKQYLLKMGAKVVSLNGDKTRCSVLLDDGTMIKDVLCYKFLRGDLTRSSGNSHSACRVGDRVLQNCGIYAELIELLPNNKCVVKFDNGCVVNTFRYNFKIGSVSYQSRIDFSREKYLGMRVKAKNGIWLTLVEYNNSSNVVVKSEDGKTSKVSLDFFKKGSASLTNSYNRDISKLKKGTKVKQRNDVYAEYIGRDEKGKLIVKFSNGVVRKGVSKKRFLNGSLNVNSSGSTSTLVGKTFANSLGMKYTIAKRFTLNNKSRKYLVKWENGLESEATLVGKLGNPTPSELTNVSGSIRYNKDNSKVLSSYYDTKLNKYVLIVENKDKVRKIALI